MIAGTYKIESPNLPKIPLLNNFISYFQPFYSNNLSQEKQSILHLLSSYHRRYWRNEFVVGLLKSMLHMFLMGIFCAILEYFSWFPSLIRAAIVYGYCLISVVIIFWYCRKGLWELMVPINEAKFLQLAKQVGQHLPNTQQDELVNILQLANQSNQSPLLEAAIKQKIEEVKPYSFDQFIQNQSLKTYFFGLLLLSLFTLGVNRWNPSIFQKSTTRIIHYDFQYPKELPFAFQILNPNLQAIAGENFELRMQLKGQEVPTEAFVIWKEEKIPMEVKAGSFRVNLPIGPQNQMFQFEAGGYFSEPQTIEVIRRPAILQVETEFVFPSYLHRAVEKNQQLSSVEIPEGTKIRWKIKAENEQGMLVKFKHGEIQPISKSIMARAYLYEKTFVEATEIQFGLTHSKLSTQWAPIQLIKVIPDSKPQVEIQATLDSLYYRFFVFKGLASDDYGLGQIQFVFQQRTNEQNKWSASKTQSIGFQKGKSRASFMHIFRMDSLGLKPGAQISYYFQVADNDGLHGPKWTKTTPIIWTFPEGALLNQQVNAEFSQMEKSLSNALEKAQGLKKELDEVMKRAQLGKEINEKTLAEIKQKEAALKKQLAELKALQDRWLGQTFSFQKPSELWQQKMADLQKMLEELNRDEAPTMNPETESSWQKSIQQKQQTEKNRALELKRLAQFYKDLKAEKILEDAIQGIQDIAEKQEKQNLSSPNTSEEAQKLLEEFRKQEDALDELKTEKPENKEALDALEPLEKEIEQDFEKLQKGKKPSDQKKTVQDLKKLAKSLEEQRTQSESMELDLNMNQLRLVLDDLLQMSFEQEKLMHSQLSKSASQQQIRLSETARVLEDTLLSLGKKLLPLSSVITKETTQMRNRMNDASRYIKERKWDMAEMRQQQAMAATNNLALLISNLLQQLQQQQAQLNPGKKGKSKQKMKGSWAGRQQKLNQKTREMQQGKGEPSTEEMVKMAQEQARIRQEIEEAMKQLGGNPGEGDLQEKLKKLMSEMDKNEEDWINKRLSQDLLNRQNSLMPELLKAEKALKEQGEDPKRESKNALQKWRENPPPNLVPYLKKQQENNMLFQKVPVDLWPKYQQKVQKYLEQFQR